MKSKQLSRLIILTIASVVPVGSAAVHDRPPTTQPTAATATTQAASVVATTAAASAVATTAAAAAAPNLSASESSLASACDIESPSTSLKSAALFELGRIIEGGDPALRDEAQAARWYRRAADHGHAGAMLRLGELYEAGLDGPRDYFQAARWYEKAANRGNAEAKLRLGVLYELGRGVREDLAEAISLYRAAAAAHVAAAFTRLGVLHSLGKGVELDHVEAVRCYRAAAEGGDFEGQTLLGWAYWDGDLGEPDRAQAAKWFRMAAAQELRAERTVRRSLGGRTVSPRQPASVGAACDAAKNAGLTAGARGAAQSAAHAAAAAPVDGESGDDLGELADNMNPMFQLGLMHELGEGVERDEAQAAFWYRAAAERGNALAQAQLAELLLRGGGLQRDPLLAYMWLLLAEKQNAAGGEQVRDLHRELSCEQIKLAEALAAEFERRNPTPVRTEAPRVGDPGGDEDGEENGDGGDDEGDDEAEA